MSHNLDDSLQELVEALMASGVRLSQQDAARLREAGITTYGQLVAAVQDKQAVPNVRGNYAWLLGKLGRVDAVPVLLATLGDDDPSVRRMGVLALGDLRDPRAIDPLITVMRTDPDPEVRKSGAHALGWLGSRQVVKPLLDVVQNQREDPAIRGMAAEALATLHDRRIIPVLRHMLGDAATEVRFWAAYSLGELGARAALSEVQRLAETDQDEILGWGSVADEARAAIARIYNPHT